MVKQIVNRCRMYHVFFDTTVQRPLSAAVIADPAFRRFFMTLLIVERMDMVNARVESGLRHGLARGQVGSQTGFNLFWIARFAGHLTRIFRTSTRHANIKKGGAGGFFGFLCLEIKVFQFSTSSQSSGVTSSSLVDSSAATGSGSGATDWGMLRLRHATAQQGAFVMASGEALGVAPVGDHLAVHVLGFQYPYNAREECPEHHPVVRLHRRLQKVLERHGGTLVELELHPLVRMERLALSRRE